MFLLLYFHIYFDYFKLLISIFNFFQFPFQYFISFCHTVHPLSRPHWAYPMGQRAMDAPKALNVCFASFTSPAVPHYLLNSELSTVQSVDKKVGKCCFCFLYHSLPLSLSLSFSIYYCTHTFV